MATTITRAAESTATAAVADPVTAPTAAPAVVTPAITPVDTLAAAPAVTPVATPIDTLAVAPAVTPATAAAVDVSAIPETPAELLKQWQAPRRPLLHTIISATLVRLWDALTGPGMTEQERANRAIAEHNGFIRNLGRKV